MTRRRGPRRTARRSAHRHGRGEEGSASYEMVLLLPVLMLMVLFVLWAGRTGQARLVADLAAEEALVAAAVCCEPGETERREQVVEAVLTGRPELNFLCIDDPRPLDGSDRFVSERALHFDDSGGSTIGVGVLGLGFGCTTDAGVGVLGGVLPPTEIKARAAEVVLLAPRPFADVSIRPTLRVADVTAYEEFGLAVFRLELDRLAAGDDPLSLWWQTEPDPQGNARARAVRDGEFGYCAPDIDEKDPYDPAALTGDHRDYRSTAGRVLIQPGQLTETIEVEVYDDCIYETAERFRIRLFGENEAAVVIDRREAVVTIRSDDELPLVALTDPDGDPDDPESLAGDRIVELDERANQDLAVWLLNDDGQRIVSGVAVGGTVRVEQSESTASQVETGECPADFALSSDGEFSIGAMTAGAAAPPRVGVADDAVYEGDERITLVIGGQSNARLDDEWRSLTITIRDDETPPVLLLVDPDGTPDDPSDPVGDRVVELDEGKPLQLRVLLSDASGTEMVSGRDVQFGYEITEYDGDGNDDITGAPASGLSVPACELSSSLSPPTVTIVDDTTVEGTEDVDIAVTVTVGDATAAGALTVRIIDNE